MYVGHAAAAHKFVVDTVLNLAFHALNHRGEREVRAELALVRVFRH